MNCWWCGQEYQKKDHVFKWCKWSKQEQKGIWNYRPIREDVYEGVRKVMKKRKISLWMSLVFAEEEYWQALLNIPFRTDVG